MMLDALLLLIAYEIATYMVRTLLPTSPSQSAYASTS